MSWQGRFHEPQFVSELAQDLEDLGNRDVQLESWIRGSGDRFTDFDTAVCGVFTDAALGGLVRHANFASVYGQGFASAIEDLWDALQAVLNRDDGEAPGFQYTEAFVLEDPLWDHVVVAARRARAQMGAALQSG